MLPKYFNEFLFISRSFLHKWKVFIRNVPLLDMSLQTSLKKFCRQMMIYLSNVYVYLSFEKRKKKERWTCNTQLNLCEVRIKRTSNKLSAYLFELHTPLKGYFISISAGDLGDALLSHVPIFRRSYAACTVVLLVLSSLLSALLGRTELVGPWSLLIF